jgi:hypothetical protein
MISPDLVAVAGDPYVMVRTGFVRRFLPIGRVSIPCGPPSVL